MPEGLVRESPTIPRRSSKVGVDVSELLTFVCNEELYAVDLRSVHEIVIPPPITIVPRAPAAVLGVCSVRGQLATIVDLRRVLGLPARDAEQRSRILLAQASESELVGLRVDEVKYVERLSNSEIEYTSQALGGDVSDGVRGIGRPAGGEVIVLLDLLLMLRKGCGL